MSKFNILYDFQANQSSICHQKQMNSAVETNAVSLVIVHNDS